MKYRVLITRKNVRLVTAESVTSYDSVTVFNGSTDTRAELADMLDACYKALPREQGFEYTVTCEVTTRFTLIDSEVLPTGDATQQKLWDAFKLDQLKESR